jgi:uncharacterized protein (TIGR01370 family)
MHRFLIACALLLLPVAASAEESGIYTRWAAYYAQDAAPEQLQMFDLLVVDPEYPPELRNVFGPNRTVLAYLSLGEAQRDHVAGKQLAGSPLLLRENKTWNSNTIDIRNPRWLSMVVEELVPAILEQGFDGIMLDTIDSPIGLELEDKKSYAGMQDAAVQLIRALREHYPGIKIMLNRGFEILPEVAADIDMVLAESIFTQYDFKTKKYNRVQESHYKSIVDYLHSLEEVNPRLALYSLDYWPLEDEATIRTIYATQRENGLVPYVATLELNKLIAEPRRAAK